MKTVAASLCFLLLTLLCFDASGGDKDQDKKKRPYASAATDCDKAISGKKSELAESYSSEVWNLKQRFQRDGDLEKALAADKEWSRSIRREPLTPDDLVESPKELRSLQDAYVDRQGRVEQEVAVDVVRDLEREAKEVAQAGNLTDGRVLQQEIDKIKRLYLSDTNTKAKKSATANSHKALEKTTPEDPVAACEEMIREKRVSLQSQYVGELEAMERSFQAKGALEDLFATKAERQRFMDTPLIAEANVVKAPEALRDLQQKYFELQLNAATSVAEAYIARLEQQKQSLTIEGKLAEAVQAKTNVEKIAQRYLNAAPGMVCPGLGRKCKLWNGDWSGTWVRRGNSNIFDCTLFHGPARETSTYVASLEVKGENVIVSRTQYKSSIYGANPPGQVEKFIWRMAKDGKGLYQPEYPTYNIIERAE